MKKPRTEDFDPNQPKTARARELHSSLDRMPSIRRPGEQGDEPEQPSDLAGEQTVLPSARPPVRVSESKPKTRRLKRHPFEFWEDQLATLKRFSLEDQLNGLPGSMSQMAREAIDEWIQKRREAGEK